jgi:tetratricopeptide (TPR) repeat protein
MGLIFLLIWLIIFFAQRPRSSVFATVGLVATVLAAYLSLRLPAEHLPAPVPPPEPGLVRPIVVARAVPNMPGCSFVPLRLHMERDVETHPSGWGRREFKRRRLARIANARRNPSHRRLGYALWRTRKRPAIFLLLLLALVAYLPVSGLLHIERNSCGTLALFAERIFVLGRGDRFRFVGRGFAPPQFRKCLPHYLVARPCRVRTFVRTFDWKDQRTFLTRTIEAGGDSARMWINLGGLELSEGHLDAARKALDRALAKEPENPLARLNLAAVLIKQGDFPAARALLKKINDPPDVWARAEESLAVLENRETGNVNLMRLRLASRLGPPNWAIEQRYIKALKDLNFPDRAIIELKTCLGVAPYRAESWQVMASSCTISDARKRQRLLWPRRRQMMCTCMIGRRSPCFERPAERSYIQSAGASRSSLDDVQEQSSRDESTPGDRDWSPDGCT